MGCYINPAGQTKEEWLIDNGKIIFENIYSINQFGEDHLPVCLVFNAMFTAAAIAYSERELQEFRREDGRPKIWYSVPKEKLYEVSDLRSYLT